MPKLLLFILSTAIFTTSSCDKSTPTEPKSVIALDGPEWISDFSPIRGEPGAFFSVEVTNSDALIIRDRQKQEPVSSRTGKATYKFYPTGTGSLQTDHEMEMPFGRYTASGEELADDRFTIRWTVRSNLAFEWSEKDDAIFLVAKGLTTEVLENSLYYNDPQFGGGKLAVGLVATKKLLETDTAEAFRDQFLAEIKEGSVKDRPAFPEGTTIELAIEEQRPNSLKLAFVNPDGTKGASFNMKR